MCADLVWTTSSAHASWSESAFSISHAGSAVKRCRLAAAKERAMGHTTLPTRRIWYGYPYEIPSDVLSDEPTHNEDLSSLRAEASRDGICYLRLLKDFQDGTYLAPVAAHPNFLPTRH